MPLSIIIVGAGIGGLATAIALRQASHNVLVLEKHAEKREVGFAVGIPPNCTRVLRELGVRPDDAKMISHEDADLVDASGDPFSVVSSAEESTEVKYGIPHMAAHRFDLWEALRKKAVQEEGKGRAVEMRQGMEVIGYDAEKGEVKLASGEVLRADVVVAADGVKSKAHMEVIGEERPATLTGLTNVRFVMPTEKWLSIPALRKLAEERPGRIALYLGKEPNVFVFRYPCRNNELQNFGVFKMDQQNEEKLDDGRTSKQIAIDRLSGFAPSCSDIIHLADENEMYLWKVSDRDPLPKLHKAKMILLGDAGHPQQPLLGQGASSAIEDAGVLGVVLQGIEDPTDVLKRLELWEKLRLWRVSIIQLMSRWAGIPPVISEEVAKAVREYLPEGEEMEMSRPGSADFCYRYDCLAEARKAVEELGR